MQLEAPDTIKMQTRTLDRDPSAAETCRCRTLWTFRNDVDPCCRSESQVPPCPSDATVVRCLHRRFRCPECWTALLRTAATSLRLRCSTRHPFPTSPSFACDTNDDTDVAKSVANQNFQFRKRFERKVPNEKNVHVEVPTICRAKRRQNCLPTCPVGHRLRAPCHSSTNTFRESTNCCLNTNSNSIWLVLIKLVQFGLVMVLIGTHKTLRTWWDEKGFQQFIVTESVYFGRHVQHSSGHRWAFTKSQYPFLIEKRS